MKILFAASEVAPFSKTGGLGDVASALPKGLAERGHEVMVISPLYGCVERGRWGIRDTKTRVDGSSLWESPPGAGPRIVFIENSTYFSRDGIYGYEGSDYPDNAERFAYFSRMLLPAAEALGFSPEILHLNDWQTGLAAVELLHKGGRTKSVFTIHNLGYQGNFSKEVFESLGIGTLEEHGRQGLKHHGGVSFLKAGISAADLVTTVSPTYAKEIRAPELGFGLEESLVARGDRLQGILNGIDTREWDPASDPHLPAHFSARQLAGKRACREALCAAFGIEADPGVMVLGMVSRIAGQKGFDILVEAIPSLMESHLCLAILGNGDPALEEEILSLARQFPRRIGVRLDFDEVLAHRVYAGSDAFLMPSRYEPCGLSQMYAMRYGAVPVVRATGGLKDTVREGETGFLFEKAKAAALSDAVGRALHAFEEPGSWEALLVRGMGMDFSWDASALAYEGVYRSLL